MLQPDKLKKLNENALKMSQAGKSKEEILAMKDAFIQQFGVSEVEKKNQVGTSTSTTPTENTASVQKVGSSATPKLTPEEKAEFDTAFKSKTVQKPKLNQPIPGATNFDTIATNEIKTPQLNLGKDTQGNQRIITANNSVIQSDTLFGGGY